MRTLIVTLILLFSNVQAEKLIFSNNNEQVDITGDVVIDNQSGNVTVTTEGGDYLIVGGDQTVILGFYPDDYEVTSSQNIEVNWTVVNADNCTASTTPTGSSSWTGSKSSNDGNNVQSNVSINQLPSTLSLVCSNAGDSVTKSFQITAQPVNNGNPTIDSFTVNSQDTFVTVSSESPLAQFAWSTTEVNSCTASASPALSGWSGTKQTSGSQNITITQDTTVTLSCDNAAPKSITIDYSEPGNPNCNATVYPSLAPNKVEMTYASANDGAPFGTSTGATIVEPFGTSQFLALSNFSTDKIDFRRRLSTFPSPTDQNPWYAVSWSVSECPGDFTQTSVCQGVMVPNNGLFFSTKQSGEPSNYCIIQPNVNYYLNFVHDLEPYDQVPGRCSNTSHTSCAIFTSETSGQ